MSADAFGRAIARFDAIHREDPSGHASHYHEKLAEYVGVLAPAASEALRLAAHCQHLRRKQLPRSAYPEGVLGYKRWRSELARLHADEAKEILIEAGCEGSVAERVSDLLLKKRLKADAEVQTFEDAICLAFLAVDFAAFAAKHPDDKVIDILRKTWGKMSERGHAAALDLTAALPDRLRALAERAVTGEA
ncbi:MAG: DUF4202 domain-containing protein [Myxococcales bacterium]|nr:DUF4202 domain-containing protein [Myxococcales bacterium]